MVIKPIANNKNLGDFVGILPVKSIDGTAC